MLKGINETLHFFRLSIQWLLFFICSLPSVKDEMDENETELGEKDFDNEEHEDSDEMLEEGTKYFYNNRNL